MNTHFEAVLAASLIAAWLVTPSLGDDKNLSKVVKSDKMPARVHVVETYETDIEKRWWLRGTPETKNLPPSLSRCLPNQRACRAAETLNFDRKMGDRTKTVKGVIFNPVPGPPMGKHTRLSFRYFLEGTDELKVQIYSLSKNYHRFLRLANLPQGKWQSATVAMTDARRPDGGGGPLAEDERIDDIQFYIPDDANLIIDDIVLFEAAKPKESRPFPRRVLFTGWFDTGKQGHEWPGDFEIVLHDKPQTWDAAKSVVNPKTGQSWIRVHMRGQRPLSEKTSIRFRYKLTGGKKLRVELANSETDTTFGTALEETVPDEWTEATIPFQIPRGDENSPTTANEIRFLTDKGATLLIDDVLVYEP